jgi:flagellar hook-associated protein 3 FlgL
MSGSVSGVDASNYSVIAELTANASATRAELDTLTEQSSTGLVSQTYAGLGASASVSLDLNPEIAQMNTWQSNINAVQGNMQVTQTAVSEISSIASSFASQLNTLDSTDSQAVDALASSAQQALVEVANLLDTTDGSTYVFAGQDSANAPVPNADDILSSGFYSAINTAVAGLGTNGAATTEASILATGSSNATGTSPFSASLSQPAATLQASLPSVQVGSNQSVTTGLLASANTYVASTGSYTTGAYMRDVLTGLATIASLSSSQVNDSGFETLVTDTQGMLQGAVTTMNQDAGVLGNEQTALTDTATNLSDTVDALTTQVSAVQDVDATSTATDLSLVQTQLQASYQVIANLGSLSLVNYL